MNSKQFAVYIMSNNTNTVLYTGVTSGLVKRVWEHKNKAADSFTSKYNCTKLVYYELHPNAESAIAREKAIKNLVRRKKNALIETKNTQWKDLYEEILSA